MFTDNSRCISPFYHFVVALNNFFLCFGFQFWFWKKKRVILLWIALSYRRKIRRKEHKMNSFASMEINFSSKQPFRTCSTMNPILVVDKENSRSKWMHMQSNDHFQRIENRQNFQAYLSYFTMKPCANRVQSWTIQTFIARKSHGQDMTLHERAAKSKQVAKWHNRCVFCFFVFVYFFFCNILKIIWSASWRHELHSLYVSTHAFSCPFNRFLCVTFYNLSLNVFFSQIHCVFFSNHSLEIVANCHQQRVK